MRESDDAGYRGAATFQGLAGRRSARSARLQDEDLDRLPLAARKAIEIVGFVDQADIDPLLYDRGYYAAPDGPAAARPYALLVEALARTGQFGIAKLALRTRERLAVLRPTAAS